MIKIRCVDSAFQPQSGPLDVGKIYEIDPRLDVEKNFSGTPTHYFVNGKRYGSWRFEPEDQV